MDSRLRCNLIVSLTKKYSLGYKCRVLFKCFILESSPFNKLILKFKVILRKWKEIQDCFRIHLCFLRGISDITRRRSSIFDSFGWPEKRRVEVGRGYYRVNYRTLVGSFPISLGGLNRLRYLVPKRWVAFGQKFINGRVVTLRTDCWMNNNTKNNANIK